MDWLDLLIECSQRMREETLAFFGSTEARIGFGRGAGGDVTKKIDLVAEKALIEVLEDHEVACTVISEESGTKKVGSKPSEFYLTTDPLDGTTNAIRGLPFIATSIAVSRAPYIKDVEAALVSDIFHDITYTAKLGQGAYRNGKRIKPSTAFSLEDAVVGVNFKTLRLEEFYSRFEELFIKIKHLRHLGANALEICYVADGTIDVFMDIKGYLRVTDIAASNLILIEAGGIMVTPEGTELNVPLEATQRVSFIAAANKKLYETIRNVVS